MCSFLIIFDEMVHNLVKYIISNISFETVIDHDDIFVYIYTYWLITMYYFDFVLIKILFHYIPSVFLHRIYEWFTVYGFQEDGIEECMY